jgi:hypothetical protein
LLACIVFLRHFGLSLCSCTPIEHGWCGPVPICTFGCRGMLRDFVLDPPSTSDTSLLHSSCSCTTCYGCCSSQY